MKNIVTNWLLHPIDYNKNNISPSMHIKTQRIMFKKTIWKNLSRLCFVFDSISPFLVGSS